MPAILKQVAAGPLLRHAGEPVQDKGVKTVADWPACLASLAGNKWVNISTMIFNRIFAAAEADRGVDWFNRHWDGMIDDRKAKINRLVAPALKPIMRRHKLPKLIESAVVCDLLQAWLLAEFEDAPAAAWSDRSMHWYLAGHIACGFTGAVPRRQEHRSDAVAGFGHGEGDRVLMRGRGM